MCRASKDSENKRKTCKKREKFNIKLKSLLSLHHFRFVEDILIVIRTRLSCFQLCIRDKMSENSIIMSERRINVSVDAVEVRVLLVCIDLWLMNKLSRLFSNLWSTLSSLDNRVAFSIEIDVLVHHCNDSRIRSLNSLEKSIRDRIDRVERNRRRESIRNERISIA